MNPEKSILKYLSEKSPLSFRDFVWFILYHPDVGYYSRHLQPNKVHRRRAIDVAVEDMLEFCDGEVLELKTLNDVEKLEDGFRGVIVANEFFTSLPFYLVDRGMEVYVDINGEEFNETLMEPSKELKEFLSYTSAYVDVTRYPACVDAAKMAELIGSKLERGFLLAIDYGLPAEEYYSRKLRIACFSEDTFGHNPYSKVGLQAVAAPVDFTALIEWGGRSGFSITGFTSYRYFLLNTIGEDELEEPSDFKSIAMPVTIKVLVMHKGITRQKLKCLRSTPSFGYWNRYNYEITDEFESGD
ncbi:MAG: hypothetical protein DRO98_07465 [Archaeoglobales archaeon]|nr:MAG: hypothetical protein DRO98_07465 [Archaeoglobales archaeon]